MKIAICASLDFNKEIGEIAEQLIKQGHEVLIPETSAMIFNGDISFEQIMKEKENGEIYERIIDQDAIKCHYLKIKESDAILVLNYDKKGINNYIGASTFLEIGFAHILGKKIFLLNDVPDMLHKDEIRGMQPVVLRGDLSKIN